MPFLRDLQIFGMTRCFACEDAHGCRGKPLIWMFLPLLAVCSAARAVPGGPSRDPATIATSQSDEDGGNSDSSCGDAESLIATWGDDAPTESESLSRVRGYLSAARCRLVLDSAAHLSVTLNETKRLGLTPGDDSRPVNGSDGTPPPIRKHGDSVLSLQQHNAELNGITRKAFSHLDSADRLLDEVESKNKAADTVELRRRSELLRAFGRAFSALSESTDSEESRQRLIDACGELAPYVDDDNKQVSESAKLWQVVAYRRADKLDRALQVARPVLSPPATPTIGLYLRIERCRALAEKGDYVAAISLGARIAARVESWFEGGDESRRSAVMDMVKALQADLYRKWADRLRADGNVERAEAAAEESRKATPRDERNAALVLDEAIAGIPELTDVSFKPAEDDDEEPGEP